MVTSKPIKRRTGTFYNRTAPWSLNQSNQRRGKLTSESASSPSRLSRDSSSRNQFRRFDERRERLDEINDGDTEASASAFAPSVLLYDPKKRLTFPLDQQPPPSEVLQRFNLAFKAANEKNRSRRPITTKKKSSNTVYARYDQACSLEQNREMDLGGSNGSPSMQSSPSSLGRQTSKSPTFRKKSLQTYEYDNKSRQRSYARHASVASSSALDYGSHRDPLLDIQQSLPLFLSDIHAPTNLDSIEQSLSNHDKLRSTPLPTRFFSSSSLPSPNGNAASSAPNPLLSDNIWSRQEQRMSSSSSSFHKDMLPPKSLNQRRLGVKIEDDASSRMLQAAPETSLRQSIPIRVNGEKQGNERLNVPSMEANVFTNGYSSDEFVYNRHSSPDWIDSDPDFDRESDEDQASRIRNQQGRRSNTFRKPFRAIQ
jgi:hypothetical protein